MDAKECLITQQPLTVEADSFAHIIPLALGGTLKPKGLISRTANDILNKRVDLRIIKLFNPVMSSLGGVREDGSAPPNTVMTDTRGDKYYTNFGTPFRATKPTFKRTEKSDGVLYTFHSRDLNDYKNHLQRIQKLHPDHDMDISTAISNATFTESYPTHPMGYELNLSHHNIFPAIFVMASLFSEHHNVGAHPLLREYVSKLPDYDTKEATNDIPLPPDTFYWLPDFEVVDHSPDTHTIFLVASPQKQKALINVELFGIYCGTVCVPYSGDTAIKQAYGINIVTGTETEPDVNWEAVIESDWSAETHPDHPSIVQRHTERLECLIAMTEQRSQEREMKRLVDKRLAAANSLENTRENAEILLDGIVDDLQKMFDSIADRYAQREENAKNAHSFSEDSQPDGHRRDT
ncbi:MULTISPECIES: HNH endonuclease [unclassified Pseudomonas]|uniref:HNH endonuclease n=1 Tax=unclassified Pseudomonas TaxID=196821 RepID=UPI00111C7E55|nr:MULTISPECIES: HNH endonuclease [unclassified Pseudomonas]